MPRYIDGPEWHPAPSGPETPNLGDGSPAWVTRWPASKELTGQPETQTILEDGSWLEWTAGLRDVQGPVPI